MEVSKLQVYSLGVVAANKALDSDDIEVTPIEDLPMVNGEITDETSGYKSSASDAGGAAYSVEAPITNTVKATWLPLGQANRVTSPDVRRGEEVVLYRFADSDKFYWNTHRNDLRLRKLETVIYGFSGTRDENVKGGPESMYYLEVSTHKKLVTFHTSKGDGEPFAYDIQINTKDGTILIQDDAGNSFTLDSKERQLNLTNGDGSYIDLNKEVLSIFTRDQVNIKTINYKLECQTLTETTQSHVENAQSIETTTSTQSLKAGSNTIEAQTNHKGNIALNGSLGQSGGSGGAGATFANDIVVQDISFVQHTHAEQGDGADVSPPKNG
jgi:hypothetical protein